MACEECDRLAREVDESSRDMGLMDEQIGALAGNSTEWAQSKAMVLQGIRDEAENRFDKARVQLIGHQKTHQEKVTEKENDELLVATLKVELESGIFLARSMRSQPDPRKALKAQLAACRCCRFVESYLPLARRLMTAEEFESAEAQLRELWSLVFWRKIRKKVMHLPKKQVGVLIFHETV